MSRAGLDILEKRKIYCPCWDLNPRMSSLQPSLYTDYATPDLIHTFITEHIFLLLLAHRKIAWSIHLWITRLVFKIWLMVHEKMYYLNRNR